MSRNPRTIEEDARLDEPDRVDDRGHSPHLTQREALAKRAMCLRWTAAGMLEAETQFRKVFGYTDLAKLAFAVELHLAAQHTTIHTPTHEEALTPVGV